jgi:FMN phosphatase YigB (HAD superfamily)
VEPRQAVYIDDTLGHVEAARQLGIHGILFTTSKELEKDLEKLITLA